MGVVDVVSIKGDIMARKYDPDRGVISRGSKPGTGGKGLFKEGFVYPPAATDASRDSASFIRRTRPDQSKGPIPPQPREPPTIRPMPANAPLGPRDGKGKGRSMMGMPSGIQLGAMLEVLRQIEINTRPV